jgi:hypothetical protein
MTTYGEILAFKQSSKILEELTPAERVFVYYIYRASIPFNYMYRDQHHAKTNKLIEIMTNMYNHIKMTDKSELLADIETYLAYLWTNHGVYFEREYTNNKRTPERIGLKYLTREAVVIFYMSYCIMNNISYDQSLIDNIFDLTVDPEATVDGSIELSGNNFYQKGFTEEMYQAFPDEIKNSINAYFSIDENNNSVVQFHCVNGHFGSELKVVIYWLCLALTHVMNNLDVFDQYFVSSLSYLIQYFATGKEEFFKKHCIEWIKTDSRLDYTMGFIETYNDPKKIRGHPGAEVTVKTMDMTKLNPVLLELEQRIPINSDFKRLPGSQGRINVSVNDIMFSAGDYGPLIWTAAYCLPNYDDIRSTHGSKQVIYKLPNSPAKINNRELYDEFRLNSMKEIDPEDKLSGNLWDVQVILHETIGHASGRFGMHTFQEGESLILNGTTYSIGDTIQVTDTNYNQLITSNTDALEELRAEINALYMSINEIDTLNELGLFKGWLEKLGYEGLQRQCIIEMARHAIRRYTAQQENFKTIAGAHAKANIVISNFLIDANAIKFIDEIKTIDEIDYHVIGVEVIDLDVAINAVTALLQLVQTIKSTGDGTKCTELFNKYTVYPTTIEQGNLFRKYSEDIRKRLVGSIKCQTRIYSRYEPVMINGCLTDIKIHDDEDYIEQNFRLDSLVHSMNI